MSVITQEYDIDLKATGEHPVVKMSQFDTGSRTIVFTVYDGRDLAQIDGMVARVDGTRSDGVEFSSTCAVGAGSKVSFTISQEMTKHAGKHAAELVIFDASGNPAGTQNFIIEVEPATMVRDSAASADDRTLYDQYTQSLEEKFYAFKAGIDDTVYRINELIGASSKPKTIIDQLCLVDNKWDFHVYMTYDPITALCVLRVHAGGVSGISTTATADKTVMRIPADYLPDALLIDSVNGYILASDQMQPRGPGLSDTHTEYVLDSSGNLIFRINLPSGNSQLLYGGDCEAIWYARGGKYIGVTPVTGKRYSFGNGLTVNANGVVSVKAGKNLGFSSDGTLNAAGGSGNAGLITAGTATANGVAVEYYTVHKEA